MVSKDMGIMMPKDADDLYKEVCQLVWGLGPCSPSRATSGGPFSATFSKYKGDCCFDTLPSCRTPAVDPRYGASTVALRNQERCVKPSAKDLAHYTATRRHKCSMSKRSFVSPGRWRLLHSGYDDDRIFVSVNPKLQAPRRTRPPKPQWKLWTSPKPKPEALAETGTPEPEAVSPKPRHPQALNTTSSTPTLKPPPPPHTPSRPPQKNREKTSRGALPWAFPLEVSEHSLKLSDFDVKAACAADFVGTASPFGRLGL